jgi:DegV family protein with EDD domain
LEGRQVGRIAVVTDSTADISEELAEAHDIHVVPLNVHFEDEVLKDYVEIASEDFFRRLPEEAVIPRTSQPSPGEFLGVFHDLRDEGYDGVVSVHLSRELSGTIQSAEVARDMCEGIEVQVVDTFLASWGVAWCAVEAAKAAQAGASLDEVASAAADCASGMHLYFVVDTLEYLERNGRIGRAAAFLGTLLRFKPVLTFEDGVVTPVERIRGRSRVLARLVEIFDENAEGDSNTVTVIHGAAEERAEKLVGMLSEKPRIGAAQVGEVGPVIGCHSGPGLVGICFYQPQQ